MKNENKNHWYDGWFYDKLIAPNLDVTFVEMLRMIEPGSTVIDIGCGTGRFVFKASERVKKAVGVDLSKRNINLALKHKQERKIDNIDFIHGNALRLSEFIKEKFDYATVSYAIHEMDEAIRIKVLNEMHKIASHIIIADYAIPQPGNKRALLNYMAEFFAGPDHFKNFLSYKRKGGTNTLLKKSGLSLQEAKYDKTGTSYIVKVV